ncbi:uncharacterized protein LOC100883474 [Megachile rotundata]|uniref:uncharacterized protein LOC100883474 n=1 Tax=Megachile rotundata TaxID=143995 RepID=UPI003FD62297
MNLLVILLIALPMCIAQFSIQGPSDGNRVAQGLTIQEGKGVQYTEQSEPVNGGFTIQGASDGHSNVQSGNDGHTNFNIRGSTDGGAERYNFQGATTGQYNIQGASDGHSQPQSIIRSSYDPSSSAKSLQYNDPSGSRVSWRSYDRQSLPGPQQQYSEATIPVRQRQRPHPQRQPQPQALPQPEPAQLPSKSLDSAPQYIKQLLEFQTQLPYVNIIPEPFRYDALVTAQGETQGNQPVQYQRQEQEAPEPRRPSYRGKPRGPPRHRRQAPEHRPEGVPQQSRRLSQPPPEPQYRYSTNLPPSLEQILKFQAQTPYINVIPEQFRFNPEPSIREQQQQVESHYKDLLSRQPTEPVVQAASFGRASTRAQPSEPAPEYSRQRRQAHQQRPQPQQLPAEPRPQYSTNIPPQIQSLLKYQAQIPYNIIANQITYRPEKPYVPQPVQSQPSQQSQYEAQQAQYEPQQAQYQAQYQPQQAQYQPQQAQYQPQQAQYQPAAQYQPQSAEYQPQYQTQADQYQGQSTGYNQQYSSQIQYPAGYQQSGNEVRPVTENQY